MTVNINNKFLVTGGGADFGQLCRSNHTVNSKSSKFVIITLKHLLPFSEYKIHTLDGIETILLENGLK